VATKWVLTWVAAIAVGAATVAEAALAPPQRGVTANLELVDGVVFVSEDYIDPGSAPQPLVKSFARLGDPRQVAMGAVVDARHGKVQLTLATDSQGHVQTGSFGGGIFQLQQRRTGPLTEVRLGGGIFDTCVRGGTGSNHQLEADVHGSFRVRGRYSIAAARGTQWLTKDTCAGTLTIVRKGKVAVTDQGRHRTVTVRAGHRYVARPR
jgi:hypothetical protein